MATINFAQYQAMGKVHTVARVKQRLLIDLQLTEPTDAIDRFCDLVTNRQEVPASLCEEINAIARGKYQRMEARGLSSARIAFTRKYDHENSPQSDYQPIVDPNSLLMNEHNAELYNDCIVNDDFEEQILPLSYQRAHEYRREAGKRRKDYLQSVLTEVLQVNPNTVDSEDVAPVSYRENAELRPFAQGEVREAPVAQDLGRFWHDTLQSHFQAQEVLAEQIYVVKDLLRETDCAKLIKEMDFSPAEVHAKDVVIANEISKGRLVMRTNLRRKVILPGLASTVWQAIKNLLPPQRESGGELLGIRSRMNFYRYAPGEYFGDHIDGGFQYSDSGASSEYTFIVYLNDCEGGATRFCDRPEWVGKAGQVSPAVGKVLIFRQRDMKHAGLPVENGYKYIVQGMVMYSRDSSKPTLFHPAQCDC